MNSMVSEKPELLAPQAVSVLRKQLLTMVDAVYIGQIGLVTCTFPIRCRRSAGIIRMAEGKGKRVYVALNIMPDDKSFRDQRNAVRVRSRGVFLMLCHQ